MIGSPQAHDRRPAAVRAGRDGRGSRRHPQVDEPKAHHTEDPRRDPYRPTAADTGRRLTRTIEAELHGLVDLAAAQLELFRLLAKARDNRRGLLGDTVRR